MLCFLWNWSHRATTWTQHYHCQLSRKSIALLKGLWFSTASPHLLAAAERTQHKCKYLVSMKKKTKSLVENVDSLRMTQHSSICTSRTLRIDVWIVKKMTADNDDLIKSNKESYFLICKIFCKHDVLWKCTLGDIKSFKICDRRSERSQTVQNWFVSNTRPQSVISNHFNWISSSKPSSFWPSHPNVQPRSFLFLQRAVTYAIVLNVVN